MQELKYDNNQDENNGVNNTKNNVNTMQRNVTETLKLKPCLRIHNN